MDVRYVAVALAVVIPALLLSQKGSTAARSQLMQFAQSRAAQRLATLYTQGTLSGFGYAWMVQSSNRMSQVRKSLHHSHVRCDGLLRSPIQPKRALSIPKVSYVVASASSDA